MKYNTLLIFIIFAALIPITCISTDSDQLGLYDLGYENNGMMPQSIVAALELDLPAPDILWDGCQPEMPGPVNCIQEDESVTFRGIDYCGMFRNQTTDRGPFDCSYDALPAQDL